MTSSKRLLLINSFYTEFLLDIGIDFALDCVKCCGVKVALAMLDIYARACFVGASNCLFYYRFISVIYAAWFICSLSPEMHDTSIDVFDEPFLSPNKACKWFMLSFRSYLCACCIDDG